MWFFDSNTFLERQDKMKTLEPVVTIGDIDVAAVVETQLMPEKADQSARKRANVQPCLSNAWKHKQPIAVILRVNGAVRAFSSDGGALPLNVFDSVYPGLRKQFESETRNTH